MGVGSRVQVARNRGGVKVGLCGMSELESLVMEYKVGCKHKVHVRVTWLVQVQACNL
jgi:hypothetical protein